MVIQIFVCTQELVCDTFCSNPCSYAKNDASSDTYQLFKGDSCKFPNTQELVFHTFQGYCNSYAKTSAGNIESICFKYGHTNFCFYVGTGIRYFWHNSLTAKSILAGEKLVATYSISTQEQYIIFYVKQKTWRAKIYLPTQCTNWRISYDIVLS